MAQEGKKTQGNGNGTDLDFEAKLWPAANKRRNDGGVAEYQRIALGFTSLTSIAAAFSELGAKLTTSPEAVPQYTPGTGA